MNLKAKFSLSLIVYTLLVLMLSAASYYFFERRAAVQSQLEEQAKTIEKMRAVCRDSYVSSNPIAALNYVGIVKSDPAVVFASCVDQHGLIIAHTDSKMTGVTLDKAQFAGLYSADKPIRRQEGGGKGEAIVAWHAPVVIGGAKVGLAQVAYDQNRLNADISLRLRKSFRQSLVAAACAFILAIFFSIALAINLSTPIRRLEETARAIGEGKLDARASVGGRRDELGSLAREMNAMADRLKELDELKDEFISNVSHDLRNPMSAIRMLTEYLLEQDEEKDLIRPKHRETLTTIMDNASRLGVYVSNILDAAKMKAGLMEYHLQKVPVEPIARNVAKLYSIMAAQREIQIAIDFSAGLPDVLADPERLEQGVANLVSNAVKFCNMGGKIIIGARRNPEGLVEIFVSNTGKGIKKEDLPYLFQRFHQAELAKQKAERVHGTGLGLVIVKESIERMGGRVEVSSEPGAGARFSLVLRPFAA